jgi:hypothetical protein
MADKIDDLLLLFIGAGWPEKRVLESADAIRSTASPDISKRYKALKKTLAKHRSPMALQRDARDRAIESSLKLLRSIGPYSESEIIEAIAAQAELNAVRSGQIHKGGIKEWLTALANDYGTDKMAMLVKQVRNELIHNPRPGWTIKDVE